MTQKKSLSLRIQIFGWMALLVLLQSGALLSALSFSNVFMMLDAEAFRLFSSATATRGQAYNASVSEVVANMASQTEQVGQVLQSITAESGIEANSLYADPATYDKAVDAGVEALMSLLGSARVSGAFIVFAQQEDEMTSEDHTHAAIYIRNTATGDYGGSASSYQLEVGPSAVSQRYKLANSINWQLSMRIGQGSSFYHKPVWAAQQYPGAEWERYGYWSTPFVILDDNQTIVSYTMPILDADRSLYGVLGIEISSSLLAQYYLPSTDIPYNNSFLAVASLKDNVMDLSWFIPNSPLAQVHLQQEGSLTFSPVAGTNLYKTDLTSLGAMYCAVEPLVMYSRNSPFYDESWVLVGFVPQTVLHETSSGIRNTLFLSIIATTTVAFAAIILMTFLITRKISGLSRYVRSLSPYMDIHFTRTGIKEIDDLTAAVEMLNKSVMNASQTTSKILELSLMPIGGFEVANATQHVVLTEYIYRLMGIEPGKQVTRDEWARFYEKLVEDPAPEYENVYRVARDSRVQWLRIHVAQTETGIVGVVMDISKDIEERRRLAHELDYDMLTHLYNRVAFKREVFHRITKEPDKIGVMIFSDLDNLKYINDTYGHEMGDRLIIRAGEMFAEFERYGGIASRISGDEFAVYLHGYETKNEARVIVSGQYEKNESFYLHTPDGTDQKIRFSSGLAFYPDDSDNVTDLLKLSDFAMYEAKHNRKGSLFEFNSESYRQNAYLLENREAINRLLDEALIRFAYQPIVDARSGEIYAYEALMRPLLHNFKSPVEILSVAAAQSKLSQLERMVIRSAFEEVFSYHNVLGDRKIFINSIPSQKLGLEDLAYLEARFSQIFGNVVVEITEAENDSPQQFADKLSFIRKHKIGLAIDDFGSGYSNEVRILSLEPDIVKIDIQLISHIDMDVDKQKLVNNLISFCHPKNIRLVAEGVERREELHKLIELDIDYIQGYYTGKPKFGLYPIEPEVTEEIVAMRRELHPD